jgi:hypothetical protein
MSSKEIKAIMETLQAIQEEGLGKEGDDILNDFIMELNECVIRLEDKTMRVDRNLAGRIKDECVQQAIMLLRTRLY